MTNTARASASENIPLNRLQQVEDIFLPVTDAKSLIEMIPNYTSSLPDQPKIVTVMKKLLPHLKDRNFGVAHIPPIFKGDPAFPITVFQSFVAPMLHILMSICLSFCSFIWNNYVGKRSLLNRAYPSLWTKLHQKSGTI